MLVHLQRNAMQKMFSVFLWVVVLGFFTTLHLSPIISLDPLPGSICVVMKKNLGLLVCLLLKGKVLQVFFLTSCFIGDFDAVCSAFSSWSGSISRWKS